MSKTIIIQSSARAQGNTYVVAKKLAECLPADRIDLLDYVVHPFRYEQDYPEADDFLRLVETYVLPYDRIVFASPVYWYSMSGPLKIFFDRLSDLLKSQRAIGRQLRDKRMAVLSCGNDEEVNDCFYSAFRLSAAYLGMSYGPQWHGWLEAGAPVLVEKEIGSLD